MKVRLLQTFLHKERGDLIEVAPIRGHLWVKQGIAEYVNSTDKLYAPKLAVVKEPPPVEVAEVIPEVEPAPVPKSKSPDLPKPFKKPTTKKTWKK